jgi:hypothetical protein
MAKRSRPWNLYWVESDGIEDCFVVAKDARSACRVEINMNGFEPEAVKATKIVTVPEKARLSVVLRTSFENSKEDISSGFPCKP